MLHQDLHNLPRVPPQRSPPWRGAQERGASESGGRESIECNLSELHKLANGYVHIGGTYEGEANDM